MVVAKRAIDTMVAGRTPRATDMAVEKKFR
jgi:hypothetical protein